MLALLPLFVFAFASLNAAVLEAPLYLQRVDEKVVGKDSADIFVVHVHVGNPASAFNLTLNMAYYESLLIGKGSTSETCSNTGHIGFDTSRSTTFRRSATKPYTATVEAYMVGRYCGIVDQATVTAGTDDFMGWQQVPFGVLSQFKGAWSPDWPSDGILGLFGPDIQFAGQPGTAKTLASAYNGVSVITWYLNQKRTVGELSGSIAFGSLPLACSSVVNDATPYFTDRKHGWNVRVSAARLGGIQRMNVGGKGFFDFSSSTLLQLPLEIFNDFMSEIQAEKNQTSGLYYVNCITASELPNLTVQLEGVTLTLPYGAYVDLASPKPKCEVLLRPDLGAGSLFWTFGNRLWASYCVTLNYDTGYVGFSLLDN